MPGCNDDIWCNLDTYIRYIRLLSFNLNVEYQNKNILNSGSNQIKITAVFKHLTVTLFPINYFKRAIPLAALNDPYT